MFYNILIVLAGLFALVEFVRSKDAFARVIMGVMIIAIGTTLVPDNSATELGFGIFLLSLLLTILYGLIQRKVDSKTKLAILLMAIPAFVYHLFLFSHWPGAGVTQLLSILVVLAFLSLAKSKFSSFKDQLGFLVVIFIDGVITTVMATEWLLDKFAA